MLLWGGMCVQLLPGRRRLRQALADRRPCCRPVVQRGLLLIKQDLLHVLQGWEVCQPGAVWQVCMRAGPKVWREGGRLRKGSANAVTLCLLNAATRCAAGEASEARPEKLCFLSAKNA